MLDKNGSLLAEANSRHRESGPTVLVVEDDALFREGLVLMLEQEGLEIAGAVGDGRAAVDACRRLKPDVVLMDVELPLLTGTEATREIVRACPATHVVMLTVSGRETDVLDALRAGAAGYLLKGTSPERLVAGIRATAAGESLLSPGITAKLLGRLPHGSLDPGQSKPHDVLSERELEILRLIAAGKHNSEIAAALVLSKHTVRNHVSNILAKLELDNRTEATALAIRTGVI